MCVKEKFGVYLRDKILYIGSGIILILLGMLPIYIGYIYNINFKQSFIIGSGIVTVGFYSLFKGLSRQQIMLCRGFFIPPWKTSIFSLRTCKISEAKIVYIIVQYRIAKEITFRVDDYRRYTPHLLYIICKSSDGDYVVYILFAKNIDGLNKLAKYYGQKVVEIRSSQMPGYSSVSQWLKDQKIYNRIKKRITT